jgi:hypothetical protein
MYPGGTSPSKCGGRIKHFPPLPSSTPAGPTSSMAVCQRFMMLPLSAPSSAGGTSRTIGPASLVLRNGIT